MEAFERQMNIQQMWLQETSAVTVLCQLAEKLWTSLKTYGHYFEIMLPKFASDSDLIYIIQQFS